MFRRKRRSFQRSIQNAIFYYALIPMLVLTAAGILLARSVLYRSTQTRLTSACRQAAALMDDVCAHYTRELEALCDDAALARELMQEKIPMQRYENLYRFVNNAPVRAAFYLLDADKQILGASTTHTPAYLTADGLQTSLIWQRNRRQPGGVSIAGDVSKEERLLLFVRCIGDVDRPAGYVLFEIGWGHIRPLLTGSTHIVMTDPHHYAFWSTDSLLLDSYKRLQKDARGMNGLLLKGTQQLYLVSKTAFNGQVILYAYSDTTTFLSIYRLLIPALIVIFVGLLALLFRVSQRVAGRTAKVVDRIAQAMENTQYHTLTEPLRIDTGDEFEKIADSYNRMRREISRLLDDNAEKARQQVISEIKQLESQFNPHFLFNTLETIRILMKLDPEGANAAILSLSELLRYSINNTMESVTLMEDVHYTQCYLQIQKSRFQERLTYRFSIDPQVENCIIPKLLLQPLVENAISYGKDAEGNCDIRIDIKAGSGKLTIAVCDSGAPLTDEEIAHIRGLMESPRNATVHVGLFNVHKRIHLAYGGDYGVVFGRCNGQKGNFFSAVLPLKREVQANV